MKIKEIGKKKRKKRKTDRKKKTHEATKKKKKKREREKIQIINMRNKTGNITTYLANIERIKRRYCA